MVKTNLGLKGTSRITSRMYAAAGTVDSLTVGSVNRTQHAVGSTQQSEGETIPRPQVASAPGSENGGTYLDPNISDADRTSHNFAIGLGD